MLSIDLLPVLFLSSAVDKSFQKYTSPVSDSNLDDSLGFDEPDFTTSFEPHPDLNVASACKHV